MYLYNYKKAFTLAEVLITLMVIGILAVVTIPSILQSWEEQATVSKLKKVYSVLQQAFQISETENGAVDTWNNLNIFAGNFQTYMHILKDCKLDKNQICFSYKPLFALNGDPFGDIDTSSGAYRFITTDNVSFAIFQSSSSCTNTNNRVNGEYSCGLIYVNLNSSGGSGIWGKDLFAFVVNKKGIHPFGGATPGNSNYHNYFCGNTDSNGMACARWVIERGNMDYLHKTTTW